MLSAIEKHPDAMWKIGTMWSFRNEAKIYGSPMFDASWQAMNAPAGGPPPVDPMPAVLKHLRSVPLPFSLPPPPAGSYEPAAGKARRQALAAAAAVEKSAVSSRGRHY